MERQPPEFGIGTYTTQSTYVRPRRHAYIYREGLAEARRAEQLGFTSMWAGEHHFNYDGYSPSIVPSLSYYAAGTERIGVGSLMLFPLHSPEEVALPCAAFGHAHPGRTLKLALALGYSDLEYKAHGMKLSERGKVMERQLDELLGDQRERFGSTELWVGAHVDRAIKRAGRYGASLALAQQAGPERLRQVREMWGEELPSDAHRPRIAVHREIWADHSAETREYVRRRLYESWKAYTIYWGEDTDNAAAMGVSDIDRDAWLDDMTAMAVIDEPAAIVDYLAELIEAGADEIFFRIRFDGTSHGQVERAMELLAAEVIPHLTDTSGVEQEVAR